MGKVMRAQAKTILEGVERKGWIEDVKEVEPKDLMG
jgi:hypothetical protein